ncbi:MAG: triphosphoribosyl-dephospho-CoA synthase, partial [Pseudomonadota bacterium]|nr:triphosphoribosyl-dephospho-CoA synthase [Pseudomonadota bacterium]
KTAINVSKEAKILEKLVRKTKKPEEIIPKLIKFDKKLKKNGINPGTSADLTVASLFVTLLQEFKE